MWGQVTQVSGGSAAASGDGDDDDEGDEGGDGDTNLITGGCKAYTWGSGGWGQLGRASGNSAESGRRAFFHACMVVSALATLLLLLPFRFIHRI